MAEKRIRRELPELIAHPNVLSLEMIPDGEFHECAVVLRGPAGSPYEDGAFHLRIHFHQKHPFFHPYVKFTTPIYHCNINASGIPIICIIDGDQMWKATNTIVHVFQHLLSVMTDPHPDDPSGNPEACREILRDRAAYEATAREWTQRHAPLPAPATLACGMEPDDAEAHAALVARLKDYVARGLDPTEEIRKNRDFHNPMLLEKIVRYFDIDDIASQFPKHIFDPEAIANRRSKDKKTPRAADAAPPA